MSERRAYVCPKCDPVIRVFLLPGDPEPKCPTHGKMKRQVNLPPKGKR